MDKPSLTSVLTKYGIVLNKNKAKCPFHLEKTASFSVKGEIFNCFGCGKKGDVFDFVMLYENCGFKRATELLKISDYRPSRKRNIKLSRLKKLEEKYHDALDVFAEFDKICIHNEPERFKEPNMAWIIANEQRIKYWEVADSAFRAINRNRNT